MKKTHRNKPETVQVGNIFVKIYSRQKAGYRVFEVADYTGGVRRMRSFNDHADARKEAERIARQLSTGEAAAAQMSGRDAAEFGRATEIIRPTGLSLLAGASRCAEAIKILGSDRIIEACKDFARRNPPERRARTVKQVADELIDLKTRRNASPRYLQELRYQLNKLCEKFSRDIYNVTTGDLQLWFDSLDAAPRSIRNLRSAAATLFRYAESRAYIPKGENPALATEKVSAKNGNDIEIYSADELTRLLNSADDAIKPVMAIQAFTGIRTAELMRLDWATVKLDRDHIEITAGNAKTASRRIVPVLPNLKSWIEPHLKKAGKIFPSGADYYHELMREAAGKTKTDELPAVELKHNALRHSFISYRVAQTQNVAQVALEAGNSPQMIFQHYRELTTKQEAELWFNILPKAKK